MMSQVFISYSHADAYDFTQNLSNTLEREYGLAIWYDKKTLAGQEWQPTIDAEIDKSFAVVVVVSEMAKQSSYVTYEWSRALGKGIDVVPIWFNTKEAHTRLQTLQALDFTNQSSRPILDLVNRLLAIRKLYEEGKQGQITSVSACSERVYNALLEMYQNISGKVSGKTVITILGEKKIISPLQADALHSEERKNRNKKTPTHPLKKTS